MENKCHSLNWSHGGSLGFFRSFLYIVYIILYDSFKYEFNIIILYRIAFSEIFQYLL